MNLYGFIRNDGINWFDRLGLELEKFERGDLEIIDSRQDFIDFGPVPGNENVAGVTNGSFPVSIAKCEGCVLKLDGKLEVSMTIYYQVVDNFGNGTVAHEIVHVKIFMNHWNSVVSKYNPMDGKEFDLIDTCEEWMDEINEYSGPAKRSQ